MNIRIKDLLNKDEILTILPKGSESQIKTDKAATGQTTDKKPLLRKCIDFFERLLVGSDLSCEQPFYPRNCLECCAYSLSHPGLFVLHHVGQPIPAEWTDQVPPNTLLVAVEPGDWPGNNCFLAKPIPLDTLRQASQPGGSMNNRRSDES